MLTQETILKMIDHTIDNVVYRIDNPVEAMWKLRKCMIDEFTASAGRELLSDVRELYEHIGRVAAIKLYKDTTGSKLKESMSRVNEMALQNNWIKKKV